jgi:hypothetical protein
MRAYERFTLQEIQYIGNFSARILTTEKTVPQEPIPAEGSAQVTDSAVCQRWHGKEKCAATWRHSA